MKILLAVVLALSLPGCMWQSVNPSQIKIAEAWCADKDGLTSISIHATGDVIIKCKSGAPIEIKNALTKLFIGELNVTPTP